MSEYTLSEMMTAMSAAFVPERAAGVDAVVQYRVSGEEAGDWVVTVRDGKCTVEQGIAEKPRLTLRIDSQDLKEMMLGRLNAMQLFMQGRLKLEGDLGLASIFSR
ncbi:MAG: SCP2 sterol-binding domain-containing protein [Anaerolineae bacterium]|nr:SCP2 sterol-binding domain-containing protein [Anaerolineae bacterium]